MRQVRKSLRARALLARSLRGQAGERKGSAVTADKAIGVSLEPYVYSVKLRETPICPNPMCHLPLHVFFVMLYI